MIPLYTQLCEVIGTLYAALLGLVILYTQLCGGLMGFEVKTNIMTWTPFSIKIQSLKICWTINTIVHYAGCSMLPSYVLSCCTYAARRLQYHQYNRVTCCIRNDVLSLTTVYHLLISFTKWSNHTVNVSTALQENNYFL